MILRVVGITGTRQTPPAAKQLQSLDSVLRDMQVEGAAEVHHGDCIGIDGWAHQLARSYRYRIVAHPPDNDRYRAYCLGADEYREPLPYLVRNHNIVDAADVLVACPEGPETLRSGTWATVRYARKQEVPIVYCMPDGKIQTVGFEWKAVI